jgi:large subunit ribosomal protein L21
MFAVIKTGGKQYRVAADDVITVEKLDGEPGAAITFGEVLMVVDGPATTIGTPLVAGASVAGEVLEQTRGDKVRIFKRKRRKHYRRSAGHRQQLTVVKITDILTGGARPAAKKAKAAKGERQDEVPAVEAASGTPAPEAATETAADTAAAQN